MAADGLVPCTPSSLAAMVWTVWDYKNPPHLDVVDRYLQWIVLSPMSRRYAFTTSKCCGFFVSFMDKKHISTQKHCNNQCVAVVAHRPNPNKEVARTCMCPYGDANVVPNSVCHLPRLHSYQYKIYQSQLYRCWCMKCWCHEYFVACICTPINLD